MHLEQPGQQEQLKGACQPEEPKAEEELPEEEKEEWRSEVEEKPQAEEEAEQGVEEERAPPAADHFQEDGVMPSPSGPPRVFGSRYTVGNKVK
jgi:peptidoglycan hydrolase CwlO-like protein